MGASGVQIKDSLSLSKHRRQRDISESSSSRSSSRGSMVTRNAVRMTRDESSRGNKSESSVRQVPCTALQMTRGNRDGGNPVVYGKWFDFNDETVSEVSCENFEKVFQGVECAYMLFYKRMGQSTA